MDYQSKDDKHPFWKGNDVGYARLHAWAINKINKPGSCPSCNRKVRLDLANISQEYKRDVTDWEWLCRRCHMLKDGRMDNLKRGRWPNKTYCHCGKQSVVRGGVCMKHYNYMRRHKACT